MLVDNSLCLKVKDRESQDIKSKSVPLTEEMNNLRLMVFAVKIFFNLLQIQAFKLTGSGERIKCMTSRMC